MYANEAVGKGFLTRSIINCIGLVWFIGQVVVPILIIKFVGTRKESNLLLLTVLMRLIL